MKRKSQAGCCGVCGRAVRRPTPEELDGAMLALFKTGWGGILISGHEYAWDDILISVRCPAHEPRPEWDYIGCGGV